MTNGALCVNGGEPEAAQWQVVPPTEETSFLAREWRRFLIGPDMDVVASQDDHQVSAGVYFLWGEDDGLQYVGMSSDIPNRMEQHLRAGRRFIGYGAVEVPHQFAEVVEAAYIHALEPPLNRKYAAPAFHHRETHAEMVAAIRALWGPKLTAEEWVARCSTQDIS